MALHSARSSTYFPAAEMPSSKVSPLRRHRHVHKEVNVGADIAFMQTAIVQTGAEKIVPAAVHIALVESVAHGIALLGAGAAEGIVPPAGIGHDGHQRMTKIGIEHAAGGQVGVTLAAQRALRIVALARVVGVVKQGINRLVAFEIEQAQGLPFFTSNSHGSPAGITWR